MLITLVAGKAFAREASSPTGQGVSGFMFGGFTEQNKYLMFFSKTDHMSDIVKAKKFDPDSALDLDLDSRIDLFSGKENWRENASE